MTWTTKDNQKIIAPNQKAFEEIRRKYFPEIPASAWALAGESNEKS